MISDELSIALFGFSLRRLEAELEGGGVLPPPHQVVENPEAHQGAGRKNFAPLVTITIKYLMLLKIFFVAIIDPCATNLSMRRF